MDKRKSTLDNGKTTIDNETLTLDNGKTNIGQWKTGIGQKKAYIENGFSTNTEQRGKYFDIFHFWFKGVGQWMITHCYRPLN